MARRILFVSGAIVLWVLWFVFVTQWLVPGIRRHLTMWPWFIAYFLCLLPVAGACAVALFLLQRKPTQAGSLIE